MSDAGFRSLADQVTAKLRGELLHGRWKSVMPGREKLAKEWEVSGKTIELALNALENEGLLARQGAGKRRKITVSDWNPSKRELRIGILVGEPAILSRDFHVELRYELQKAGHTVVYTPRHMLELRMSVPRIARMVQSIGVDAWIVNAGSREVLEWFSKQELPVFAMFGRRRGLNIAGTGPRSIPPLLSIVRRLSVLGHRRIVFLVRQRHREPQPSAHVQAFLEELKAVGIKPTSYHLPAWQEDATGLERCLKSLFQITPPTALIADEPSLYFATVQHLMHEGIRVPQDLSLACADHNPHFDWCKPSVAHITWNSHLVARHALRWTNHLARGKNDKHLTFIKAKFVDGETMGPAKK